jgi:hypothetical protein
MDNNTYVGNYLPKYSKYLHLVLNKVHLFYTFIFFPVFFFGSLKISLRFP